MDDEVGGADRRPGTPPSRSHTNVGTQQRKRDRVYPKLDQQT